MILRIVNFTLSGIDDEQFQRHAATVADGFNQWEGLTAKLWLHDPHTGTYGGAYLFADQAAADASRATDLFRGMEANPAFADLTVREYEVIDHLTAITGGATLIQPPAAVGSRASVRAGRHTWTARPLRSHAARSPENAAEGPEPQGFRALCVSRSTTCTTTRSWRSVHTPGVLDA